MVQIKVFVKYICSVIAFLLMFLKTGFRKCNLMTVFMWWFLLWNCKSSQVFFFTWYISDVSIHSGENPSTLCVQATEEVLGNRKDIDEWHQSNPGGQVRPSERRQSLSWIISNILELDDKKKKYRPYKQ